MADFRREALYCARRRTSASRSRCAAAAYRPTGAVVGMPVVGLFVCFLVCLFVCLFASLVVCLFACLLAWRGWFLWLFVCLSVCLFVCFFGWLFVCLFACMARLGCSILGGHAVHAAPPERRAFPRRVHEIVEPDDRDGASLEGR